MYAFKKYFLLAFIALSFTQCKILQPNSIAPSYSAAIIQDVTDLGKQIDILYITMEQSSDKSYETYLPDYLNSEVLINSIILRDQIRPKSAIIVKQAELFRNLFIKYKGEHKVLKTLNNSQIRIYKRYLQDQLKPLMVSELSLK